MLFYDFIRIFKVERLEPTVFPDGGMEKATFTCSHLP